MMMGVQQLVEMISGGNQSTRRKPTPVPLSPPQIPHERDQASNLGRSGGTQWLTAWATERPTYTLSLKFK
jgi:hypothetical protein